jgi:predicted nucleotidyltransferase
MNSIFCNLSGKLDPSLVNVLRAVDEVASSLEIPFFVIGAMARDIVLEHCHSIRPSRGTLDLDVGVQVAGWDEFQRLSAALVAGGNFSATREVHAFRAGSFRLDLVPFGKIGGEKSTISWPPADEVRMDIMGFHEAYENSIAVRLSERPVLDVKVPTIPGLALLKIISWHDSYPERPKDAEDLLILMDHYAEAGNEDRLYGEESELLQTEEFDPVMAGIRLLGRDMASMASDSTGEAIASLLESEVKAQGRTRLVRDMMRGKRLYGEFDEMLLKVKKLEQGFREHFRRGVPS